MSTYCHELKHKITFGSPFFIITKENMKGGTIVSIEAMNRISLNDRLSEKVSFLDGVDIYAASSIYSKGDTYSWFNIKQEEYLFSLKEDVFSNYFPNCKAMFQDAN
jgi:hypothetical protein